LRILAVTPTFLPMVGGAELGLYEIYRRLSRCHAVKVLTPKKRGVEGGPMPGQETEVWYFRDRLMLGNMRGYGMIRGIVPPISLSFFPVFREIVEKFAPDVVHCAYAIPYGINLALLKSRLRPPVVLSLIGRDVPGPGVPRLWTRCVRWVADKCDHVVYISQYCRESLGLSRKEWSVIPFGVDCGKFSSPRLSEEAIRLRGESGLGRDDVVLLALQRLSAEKRVDVVIDAVALLMKQAYPNVRLVIGGTGELESRLRKQARELGLHGRILFAGYIPDSELAKYFAMSDIFVFHSVFETFGIVLAEAMAAGKPIVSVESTAIPELVEDGINGLLVPPLDPEEMAKALIRLVHDRSLRKKMGDCNRRKARAFDWEDVADRYEKLLEQVADVDKEN